MLTLITLKNIIKKFYKIKNQRPNSLLSFSNFSLAALTLSVS